MLAKTIQGLATLGVTLLWTYDNFDVLLKGSTTALENSVDPLKQLTSARPSGIGGTLEIRSFQRPIGCINQVHKVGHVDKDPPPRYHELLISRVEESRVLLFLRDLIDHGPKYFRKFRGDLLLPVPIGEPIPVAKTEVILLQSMDVCNSTVAGILDTIVKLLEQTDLGGYEPPIPTVSLDQQILLFHGDLGTGDQIHTAKQWRSIETPSTESPSVCCLRHGPLSRKDGLHGSGPANLP